MLLLIAFPSDYSRVLMRGKLTDQQLFSEKNIQGPQGLVTRLRSPLVLGIHAINREERAWWGGGTEHVPRPWGSKKHRWSVNTARWGQLPVPLLAPPSPSSSFLSCGPQSTRCTFTEWAVPFQGDDPMGQVWSRTLTLDHQPGNIDVSKVSRPASPGRGSRTLQRRGCGCQAPLCL